MRKAGLCLILCTALSFLTSCKKDDNPAGPPGGTGSTTITYAGTFAGVSETGSMKLTVTIPGSTALEKTTAIYTVSGTITINGGSSVSLTGTFNSANDSLNVSGGGYTFRGVLDGTTVTGTYSGPGGSGAFTLKPSSNNSVKVFCGSYTSNAGHTNGKFNLAWDSSNQTLSGVAVSDSNDQNQISGIVVADSIKVYLPGYTNVYLALGKFTNSADTAGAGVYDNHTDDHGIWSFLLCH